MDNKELQNITVMVTRPRPQGEVVCLGIQAAGGRSIFFPTIEIESLTQSSDFLQTIAELNTCDWVIFISPQAVYQATSLIQCNLPLHFKVAAIGGGTALALQEAGIPLSLYPKDQWNSEGLLLLPEFKKIKGKRIALVSGEGGRAVLANELIERGAKVIHLIAYRRILPACETDSYLSLLRDKKIDIIITTSNDILQNLNTLLGQAGLNLYRVPLIVISERMVPLAKKLGFRSILLAKNASFDAIMTTLKDYIPLCQTKLKKQ
jgi:uroporphyrinogen-III synthase